MIKTNGSIKTKSMGTSTPANCSAVVSESDIPKSTLATMIHLTLPRTSMASTIAMKPLPFVTNGTNSPAPTSTMNAPPSPANSPVESTAIVRVRCTPPPAASSACGWSPAALMLSPIPVDLSTQLTKKTTATARYADTWWLKNPDR